MSSVIKIVECPRDAMQGIPNFIATKNKILYINQLLKVGFDTIDFGSFVSPKRIPQLKDTAKVLSALELENSSKLENDFCEVMIDELIERSSNE